MSDDEKLIEDKIRAIIKEEQTRLFEFIFGININDPAQRLKTLQRMQSLLENGRINDFEFLRKQRLDAIERKHEMQLTFWSTLRKFIAPVVSAIAAAIVSWIGYNHKSH